MSDTPDKGSDFQTNDPYPLRHADITATERFLNYSRSIQQGVFDFLTRMEGQLFTSLKALAMESANNIVNTKKQHPSSITTQRWIEQFTAPGETFILLDQPAGIVVARRSKEV